MCRCRPSGLSSHSPYEGDKTLICAGIEIRSGDIVFHASGERFHERTVAPSRWGTLSMRVEALSLFGRTLTGDDIAPPPTGLVIHPTHQSVI
jgi:hypothetical protein